MKVLFSISFALSMSAWATQCADKVAELSVLKRAVVVVDAYSSAYGYGIELRKRGFGRDRGMGPLIHVLSSPDVPAVLLSRFRPQDWDEKFAFTTLEQTLQTLRQYEPIAVFAGTETGVNLADQLSEGLGLRTNGTRLSEARRNKYLMAEVVRTAGIPAVKQAKAKSFGEVKAFAQSHGQWPVVIKPLHSAATDGVTICRSEQELRVAYDKIMGKKNALGLMNLEVLVQEFLEGDEYILDVVAREGQFVISDIWKYHKKDISRDGGVFRVYDWDELLPYEGEVQRQLIDYGLKVLRALGNLNGPSHMEVMMTRRGPILVEVAARLGGTDIPSVVRECTGRGQVELTVDAYLFPWRFQRELGRPYVLYRHGRNVDLISQGGKVLPGFREALQALPSYWKDSFHFSTGEELPVTRDLLSSPGTVFLIHPDPRQLAEDTEAVRRLTAQYFDKSPSTPTPPTP